MRSRNAESRARALSRASAIEEKVRQLHRRAGSKLHSKLMERPDVQRAVEHLAREHGIDATAGWSWSEAHSAGGVPLIDREDWTPVVVLDPAPGQVSGDALRLLAGMLLLFPTREWQKRFDRNTRRRRKVPIDGYRTEHMEAPATSEPAGKAGLKAAVPQCRRAGGPCRCPEPELIVTISGQPQLAEPSDRMTPAAALYTASCRTCGGPYDKPWRCRTS
ncbi:hypothetical protein AB0C52_30485 [Streptomyces sp. NPDC048717]|uniref:hypothetical protein n=1 Tax=Streptomyces sp. NPDC048717 TaxID=3154928 RepID=UPI003425F146